jgi:hypothetical protein
VLTSGSRTRSITNSASGHGRKHPKPAKATTTDGRTLVEHYEAQLLPEAISDSNQERTDSTWDVRGLSLGSTR